MKRSIYDLTRDELIGWTVEHGQPEFRAEQLFDWLYEKRCGDFKLMSNLPKSFREVLEYHFLIDSLTEIARYTSKDGTVKFLFGLEDGHAIETVVMRHQYGISICVTTQVGCRIGCTFCASTLGGLKRNLTAGEIVAQVVEAQRRLDESGERIKSIVVMGIGEPFDNYEALMRFIKNMTDRKGMGIGQRHITVSTSGIVPKIYRFADENTQVSLAISLHAPNDELRSKLMPINRRHPFDELMQACRYYIDKTGRRISFEYALIGGRNDQPEHAEELAQLLEGMLCHVNLIPVNHVPERGYVRTPRNEIFRFQRIFRAKNINVTIRREQGHDIEAACGQLRAKHLEMNAR